MKRVSKKCINLTELLFKVFYISFKLEHILSNRACDMRGH